MTIILDWRTRARARAMSWRCPWEKLEPFSLTGVSSVILDESMISLGVSEVKEAGLIEEAGDLLLPVEGPALETEGTDGRSSVEVTSRLLRLLAAADAKTDLLSM